MEKKQGSNGDKSPRVDPNKERLKKLEAAEYNEERRRLEELAKARNLADASEIINYTNIKKKLELPSLGYHVEYCPLRIEDRIEINRIVDNNLSIQRDKRNRKTIHLLLSRANPDVWTEDVVNQLAAQIIDIIIIEHNQQELGSFLQFLLPRKSSG